MLEDLTAPLKELPCAVRRVFQRLDESDQVILNEALQNVDAWPAKTLSRALRTKGVPVGDGPIRKHRLGICSCR